MAYLPFEGTTVSVTVNYEAVVRERFIAENPGFVPFDGGVKVEVEAVFDLNGLAYGDDKQVVDLIVRKFYGVPAHVSVSVAAAPREEEK